MVLIVLDDVSKSKQLEHLVGDGNLFACGSRILKTTRDLKVLRKIKDRQKDINDVQKCVYQVEQLNDEESLTQRYQNRQWITLDAFL